MSAVTLSKCWADPASAVARWESVTGELPAGTAYPCGKAAQTPLGLCTECWAAVVGSPPPLAPEVLPGGPVLGMAA